MFLGYIVFAAVRFLQFLLDVMLFSMQYVLCTIITITITTTNDITDTFRKQPIVLFITIHVIMAFSLLNVCKSDYEIL